MAEEVVTAPARRRAAASSVAPVTSKTASGRKSGAAAKKAAATVGDAVPKKATRPRVVKRVGTVKTAAKESNSVKQSPRERRRQQRIELSREQILDTAEELFAERGYYETGLKDVAARCEFSVGSIYTFFDSKDVLYEQVLMRRSLSIEALEELLPESVPTDRRLVNLARIWIDHAVEYPAWGALTAEVTRLARSPGSVIPEAWSHQTQQRQKYIVDLIKQGQADGTLRHGSPTSLGRLFYAVVTSFIVVTTMGRMHDTEEPDDAEEFLGFVQDTFSTRPTTNPFHEDFDD